VILDEKDREYEYTTHHSYSAGVERSFYIEPWYSPKNGYLQIYKQSTGTTECEEKITAKIFIRSPKM
jgi:hypothetical protein